MEVLHNVTNQDKNTDVDKPESIDPRFEEYAAFTAVGGLLTDDDGQIRKMSLTEFSTTLGLSRMTLNRWKKDPKFWPLVEAKRNQIFTQSRITAVWNGLFLRAAKGDAEQAKIILGQFANWQPPQQKQVIELGDSWAALLANKRKQVINGEVVDESNESSPN